MFDPTTLTGAHTIISLMAIALGFLLVPGLLQSRPAGALTALFLATAVITSVSGYFFPFLGKVLPSHIVGAAALIVLAAVIAARYRFGFAGLWRPIYAGGIVISLYLLVFVAVAQAFLKVPFLNAYAPTGSEPPFAIAQGIVFLIFAGLGLAAVRSFHPRHR